MSMRKLLATAALALLLLPAPVRAQADTYLDEAARELVTRARERRGLEDHSIQEYRALSHERVSASMRLLRRERLLYRRETAAALHWRRQGDTEIEVLGAREVLPVATGGVQVPDDLADYMPRIAFDPLDSEFLIRFDTSFIRHPLAVGAEQHYRYAAGDSSVVRLPDGREVRLRELRIIPRRRDTDLIAGSFWIHTETYAVVQAAFRLARGYSLAEDPDQGAVARTLFGSFRADFSHFAVDYGLWELRWWLPRSLVVEGVLELGSFGAVPLQYERRYSEYEVSADTTGAVLLPPDSARQRCRGRMAMRVSVSTGRDTSGLSPTERARAQVSERQLERDAAQDSIIERCGRRFVVSIPDSVRDVLASDHLPSSIYAESELLSSLEREQLEALVRNLPLSPWQLRVDRLEWGPYGAGLLRYNAVEGLGVGARLRADLARATAALEVGYGLADEWPKALLALEAPVAGRRVALRGYRELAAVDPLMRPFSFASSASALLFGRDDALYQRAAGAELRVTPPPAESQWYALRLYFERQSATRANAEFSVAHLLDDTHAFRPNITADRAKQLGAEAVLRADYGRNPDALRLGAQFDARAETGSFGFVRPALTLRAALPPLGPVASALEVAAGTTFDASPVQSRWYLGGTHTLRGYGAGALAGRAFWRARGELGTALPLARLTLFSDVGWAGEAAGDALRQGRPLLSVGAGASLLDGVVRLDLARATRAPTGWRLHFYLDGVL